MDSFLSTLISPVEFSSQTGQLTPRTILIYPDCVRERVRKSKSVQLQAEKFEETVKKQLQYRNKVAAFVARAVK